MTRRNILERHTDHCSRHQRQLFSRSGRTRLSYNTVEWQRAKTAKHKILISVSNFAHCFHILTVYWACSICMNPVAGPKCKNFAMVLTVHELRILFVESTDVHMLTNADTCKTLQLQSRVTYLKSDTIKSRTSTSKVWTRYRNTAKPLVHPRTSPTQISALRLPWVKRELRMRSRFLPPCVLESPKDGEH